MKQTIKLRESELKRMIMKSVKKVLNEDMDPFQARVERYKEERELGPTRHKGGPFGLDVPITKDLVEVANNIAYYMKYHESKIEKQRSNFLLQKTLDIVEDLIQSVRSWEMKR